MKIGIVGYQGSGKSTLFAWLTGIPADPALAHTSQSAMAEVPDERIAPLCDIYKPKKVTLASIELVDTPGLSRTHEKSAARLALIREAGCLVVVVAAYGSSDPVGDLQSFDEDLLIADLEVVSGRVQRLQESVKKPRPDRDKQLAELEGLQPVLAALESGQPLRALELSPEQTKAIKSFQLFSQKPRLIILNLAEDAGLPDALIQEIRAANQDVPVEGFSISLQAELAGMSEDECAAFCEELGANMYDRDQLLRQIMDQSGQMLFYTGGPKEVRTWMIPQGATAGEAAASIHTDLEKTFVRAETIRCTDLIRLGSEREVKAQNLMRHEHKGYVVQEGELLHILASS